MLLVAVIGVNFNKGTEMYESEFRDLKGCIFRFICSLLEINTYAAECDTALQRRSKVDACSVVRISR